MSHPFTEADALRFAHDLGLHTPPPAQPAPPTPPTDAAQGGDDGDGDTFDIEMIVVPPGGATYRSAIEMTPNPSAVMLLTAVLQAASGALAQLGVHSHLFATTPAATPQPAPTPPYRPEEFRPTPTDVANGRCNCPACRARNGGGQ